MIRPEDLAEVLKRVAHSHGVTASALLACIAPLMRGTALPTRRLLTRKANEILALRVRLAEIPRDAALAQERGGARQALEAGDLIELDKSLARVEVAILGGARDLAGLPLEARLMAGETRADRAAISLLLCSPDGYREGMRRFGEAAAIIGLADIPRSHALALAQADAAIRLSEDLGGIAGFEEAVALLRRIIGGLDNFDDTVSWASAQDRLATALTGLASGAAKPALLQEAVDCCRLALEDLRQVQAPTVWKSLQRQLGALTLELGKQSNDGALFEEAAEALRLALHATDRAAEPQAWARVQYDLGRALLGLGRINRGMAELENAFNAFAAAVTVWTREREPARWSELHDRMGQAVGAMGERYSETVVLEEAIALFDFALEERSRETGPLAWATTIGNRGLARMQLAERNRDAALAQQALTELMSAVETLRASGNMAAATDLQAKLAAAGAVAQRLARR